MTHPGPQTINLSYLPQRSRSLQEKDQKRAHIPPTISQTPSPQFSRCHPYSPTRANPRVRPISQYCTSSGTNDKLINWLNPAVNVLYSFSEAEAIGAGLGLVSNKSFRGDTVQGLIFVVLQVYPPAGVILPAIGVLLSVSTFLVPLHRLL